MQQSDHRSDAGDDAPHTARPAGEQDDTDGVSDPVARDAIRRGKPISAKRAARCAAERDAALVEAAQWRETNSLAAQTLVQKDDQIGILESQLGQAHEQLTILQDASKPAARALRVIAQMPAIDGEIREVIMQLLAPLDAALAATKGCGGE